MKSGEIANKLKEIGTYYSSKPLPMSNKKFSFFKASQSILTHFGSDHEVDEFYDFTLLDGIAEGIQRRINDIIIGNVVEDLVTFKYSKSIFKELSDELKTKLVIAGIDNDEKLISSLLDTRLVNIIPDILINKLGRIRTTRVSDLIKLIIKSLPSLTINKWELVGSFRRGLPTIKDLDILIESNSDEETIKIIDKFEQVGLLLINLNAGYKMRRYQASHNGITINIDLKFVASESFGSAMIHFTGPASLNISTRAQCKKLGYTLNEYGLYKVNKCISDSLTEEKLIMKLREIGVLIPLNPKDRN